MSAQPQNWLAIYLSSGSIIYIPSIVGEGVTIDIQAIHDAWVAGVSESIWSALMPAGISLSLRAERVDAMVIHAYESDPNVQGVRDCSDYGEAPVQPPQE